MDVWICASNARKIGRGKGSTSTKTKVRQECKHNNFTLFTFMFLVATPLHLRLGASFLSFFFYPMELYSLEQEVQGEVCHQDSITTLTRKLILFPSIVPLLCDVAAAIVAHICNHSYLTSNTHSQPPPVTTNANNKKKVSSSKVRKKVQKKNDTRERGALTHTHKGVPLCFPIWSSILQSMIGTIEKHFGRPPDLEMFLAPFTLYLSFKVFWRVLSSFAISALLRTYR
jgi:hypothetical protein